MLEQTKANARNRAREQAQRQADTLREELGRMAFEMAEGYFPEEAQSRRRKTGVRAIAVGFALGLLVGLAIGRR